MLRRRGDHARRLSEHERRELRRRVAAGETFASAAAAVGCSTKSIQRLLAPTGGLERRPSATTPWSAWTSPMRRSPFTVSRGPDTESSIAPLGTHDLKGIPSSGYPAAKK